MIVRIEGVSLPENKRFVIALTYIKGLGLSTAKKILEKCQIDENIRTKDITEEQVSKVRSEIESLGIALEADLQRSVFSNVKRLKEIGALRGLRHGRHLPVRGQRTKTNSRTVRGNVRKTATSGKKPAAQKT